MALQDLLLALGPGAARSDVQDDLGDVTAAGFELGARGGARMLEGWAGLAAEAITQPGLTFDAMNPFDAENDIAARELLRAGQERTERTGPWLSGEMSSEADALGQRLGADIQRRVGNSPAAQAVLGTLEDESLQVALELLPGLGGLATKGTRRATRSALEAEGLEQYYVATRGTPGDPQLTGPRKLGDTAAGRSQRGILAGRHAITNLEGNGQVVRTSHGELSGSELRKNLVEAQRMKHAGEEPDAIWGSTGFTQGADDEWRFEIDDSEADILPVGTGQRPLSELIPHEEAFKAYPDMDMIVDVGPMGFGLKGAYYAESGPGSEYIEISEDLTELEKLSTGIHEIQHAIQQREGFDSGTAPRMGNTVRPELYDELENWNTELRGYGFPEEEILETYALDDIDAMELSGTLLDQAPYLKYRRDGGTADYESDEFTQWSMDMYNKARERGESAEAPLWPVLEDVFKSEKPLDEQIKGSYEVYRTKSGEVEARNVQTRRHMEPEVRRRGMPKHTEDFYRSEQWTGPVGSEPALSAEDPRTWYHGTSSTDAGKGIRYGGKPAPDVVEKFPFDRFDIGKSEDGAPWFTPNPEHAGSFGEVGAFNLSPNKVKTIHQTDLEDALTDDDIDGGLLPRDLVYDEIEKAKAEGYDALEIKEFGDMDFTEDVMLPFNADAIQLQGQTPSIKTPTEYQKPAVPGEAIRLGPRNRKAVPEILNQQFTNRGDDFWGVNIDDEGASSFANTDYSGTQCTGYACAVKHKLEPGRAQVMGFSKKDNPKAGTNDLADGHDFALVDNRYIVDPWLSEVEAGRITTHDGKTLDVGNQVVFDLKKDGELIEQIYGDQGAWKEVNVPDRPFFDESLYRAMSKPDPEYARSRKSDAPLPERAQSYPATLWPESAWDENKGKYYASKAESPEGAALLKARTKAQRDMDKNGYTPYFDISKRYNVDPSNYTRRADTQVEERYKDPKAEAAHAAAIKTPEARARMDEAYARAEPYAGAHDWYGMGQLEAEFVKELGPKSGRKAFRDRFSDAMATTTGGSSPKDNFTNAMYGNYLANLGQTPPAAAFDMPSPIGGRYISGNMKLYDEVANQGRVLDAEMPKRHNFSGNFEGFMDRSTIDEQMTEMATPGKKSPEGKTYGIYEELVDEMAQTRGVQPGNFQDVSWAGTKLKAEAAKKGKSSYVPQPMIETVNEAIERTSRITGQSPEEVLKYGIIRGETPVYSHPAAAIGAAAAAGKGLEQALLSDDEMRH